MCVEATHTGRVAVSDVCMPAASCASDATLASVTRRMQSLPPQLQSFFENKQVVAYREGRSGCSPCLQRLGEDVFQKVLKYSKIEGVHAETRLRALLHLFRVLTVLSVGAHEVPSQKRSKEYLFLVTAPAVTNAVAMTLFQLGRACANDTELLLDVVLPCVEIALWIEDKSSDKVGRLVEHIERGVVVPSYLLDSVQISSVSPKWRARVQAALDTLRSYEEEDMPRPKRRFKRPRAAPDTRSAAIASAAHQVAQAAVKSVVAAAREREAATRKMSANVAAAAVATVLKAARQRDSDAVRDQAARVAVVQRANAEAGRKRAIAQKRAVETKLWAKEMKKAAKAEKTAMAEAERRRMQDLECARAKDVHKAQRVAEKALLSTKPVNTKTKLVTDSHTSVLPVTKAVTNSKAPVHNTAKVPVVVAVSTQNAVAGSDPAYSHPARQDNRAKRKSPLHGSKLAKWTLPDFRYASAIAIQSAWRRHVAVQLCLLAQYHKAAAMKNAPETEQATHRNDVDANTNKTTMRSTKPMCTYTPCLRPGCRFSHSDNQFQPDAAKFAKTRAGRANHTIDNAKTGETKVDKDAALDSNATKSGTDRTESTNECPVCFTGLALDNIGVLACGHCACFKCAQACVARDARCPICRAEATSVLKMRV
jgi:hypothetical protein